MRILYAAGNHLGSYYIVKRFLNSISGKGHDVKVAAYKKSMGDLNADYTLDCLLNFTDPDSFASFNGNYNYYRNEVKRFNPDLIISDFDVYTSTIAVDLKIKLWIVSPINLYYALDARTKQNAAVHKNYSHLLEANPKRSEHINASFQYSNRKFVLSHLCDCENPPELIDGFEWSRPSFILGENVDKYYYVIATTASNKRIIDEYKNKHSILCSSFMHEKYDMMKISNIESNDYKNALENCKVFICDGTSVFLADAFYNQKYAISIPRYDDIETIIASHMNEYCGVGKINYGPPKKINVSINENVKFISEYLEQL